MTILKEINSIIKCMCKNAQAPGYFHMQPEHAENAAKGVFKAPIAAAGSVLGGAMGAVNGMKGNEVPKAISTPLGPTWSPILHTNWRDVFKGTIDGAKIGAKTGWNEAGRVYSDLATTGVDVANSFGLVNDNVTNKVHNWNDYEVLRSAERAGVDLPEDNEYRFDENGRLQATGDPRYAEFDSFVNGARIGQGVGSGALGWAAFGGALGAANRLAGGVAKAVHAGKRATKAISSAPSLAVSGMVAKDIGQQVWDIGKGLFSDDYLKQAVVDKVNEMRTMDHSTPEYAERYNNMRKVFEEKPNIAVDDMPKPTIGL